MPSAILALLQAAALAAAGGARADESSWSLTLGGWAGAAKYDVLGLEHGVSSLNGQDLLAGTHPVAGGSAVVRVGPLELGALYEGTLSEHDATSDVITPLFGFALDLSERWRLELLGEVGGHRISWTASDPLGSVHTVWLPYIGARPSLALRLPAGGLRLVLSVTPFARWDLARRQVDVQSSSGTSTRTTYDVGGTTFGLVGGVGIEI